MNTPGEMFPKSKLDTAYEVELENGAYWFGGVGTLKIAFQNMVFCSVSFYGGNDNTATVEADIRLIHPETPQIVEGNGEKRLVFEINDGNGAVIHQQVEIPGEEDLLLFRTVILTTKAKK